MQGKFDKGAKIEIKKMWISFQYEFSNYNDSGIFHPHPKVNLDVMILLRKLFLWCGHSYRS